MSVYLLGLLGESSGVRLQNLILLISAAIALWTIRSTSKQERSRATIDMVVDQRNNEKLQTARTLIRKLRNKDQASLKDYFSDPDCLEYQAIRTCLNAYEFLATGIRAKALDEVMYKRLRYSTVIKDWQVLSAAVAEFRQSRGSQTLFQDFEWLALRWQKRPLKRE